MKKYFAKYLPVAGKEQEGKPLDIYVGNIKLFLCSRDIKVQDRVIFFQTKNNDSFGTIVEIFNSSYDVYLGNKISIINIPKNGCFKVIGEISKNAIWVKEGDEFDKEELEANGVGPNWSDNFSNWKFKIKCDKCETYH